MGLLGHHAAWWARSLMAALCTLSSTSRARPAPIPTELAWVTTVCQSGDFSSRVLSRTRAVRFVASGARFTVRLSIEPRGPALEASVRIEGPGGPDTVRQIASQNCEDALDALALVVAISLEARASASRAARPSGRPTPPAQERAPEAPPPEPAPTSPPPREMAPLPEVPALPEAEEPAAERAAEAASAESPPRASDVARDEARDAASPRSVPDPERRSPSGFGLGVSALLSLGVAPSAMIGAELWLRWSWELRQALSPEVNVSFAHQRLDGYRQPEGSADFALNVGNLALCPVRLGSSAHVRPCATVSLGQFSSAGHRTFSAAARDRPWLAFGVRLQGHVPLGPLELRAAAGAALPVVRDAFRFGLPCTEGECGGTFDRVDELIWSGAAGLGVSF